MSPSSTPPRSAPATLGGVFAADPTSPPMAPVGAEAVEIRDASGETIAFCWVAPGYANERFHQEAWDWFETHTSPPTPPLRVIR